MEFNKIAAGCIGALLVFLLLNFVSGEIYGTREAAEIGGGAEHEGEEGPVLAYAVAIEDAGSGGEEAAPEVDLLALFQQPDVAAGEKTYRACAACHSDEKGVNKVGPSLWDVVGRDVASVSDFAYSDAMQAVEGDWTPEHMYHFLANPKKLVPGTKMSFAGLKDPQDRVNVIAFLNQHGDAPVDLTAGIEPLAAPGGEAEKPAGKAGGEKAGEGEKPAGEGDQSKAEVPADKTATDTASTEGKAESGGVPAGSAQSTAETTSTPDTGEKPATVTGHTIVDTSKDDVKVETTPMQVTEKDAAAPQSGEAADKAAEGDQTTMAAAEPATGAGAASEAPKADAAATTEAPKTETAATSEAPKADATASSEAPKAEASATAETPKADATASSEAPKADGSAAAGGAAAGAGTQVAAAASGDASAGEKLFRRCAVCHKVEPGKNGIGPTLYGVVGRPVASVEGYDYSKAMHEHGGDWTPERLSEYLADPKGVVPGTKMAFAGLKKEQERADVITYLQQQAAK